MVSSQSHLGAGVSRGKSMELTSIGLLLAAVVINVKEIRYEDPWCIPKAKRGSGGSSMLRQKTFQIVWKGFFRNGWSECPHKINIDVMLSGLQNLYLVIGDPKCRPVAIAVIDRQQRQ